MASRTVVDMFVEGARKGWQIGIHSILPNVVMAYALIRILEVSGLLKLVGQACAPVMALFGLPGEAIMVNLAALLSMGGAVGVALQPDWRRGIKQCRHYHFTARHLYRRRTGAKPRTPAGHLRHESTVLSLAVWRHCHQYDTGDAGYALAAQGCCITESQ